MTTITRKFPWFIRDTGISIIGTECYTSLVENLDIQDVECLKYSLSKALGIGIVVGGSVMKLPQLLLILRGRSARGLSLSAYVLETLAYGINLSYSFRNMFPFSTYGENLFLTIQNILITFLIIFYTPSLRLARRRRNAQLSYAFLGLLIGTAAVCYSSMPILAFLQLSTLPLSLTSKVPQIRQNYRSKSTGQLSAFAVCSQILGCLARLFTTATEVGDWLVSAGFALALVLNGVLGLQLWMYWGKDIDERNDDYGLDDAVAKGRANTASYAPWQTQSFYRIGTPPLPTTTGNIRRGTRKSAADLV
ncbi:mannose-P-dolichol utilization defect 1 protein [Lentinula guzmanii]|uniref:Mannose-P-dolichol utilization defect 1 protein n=1 Tax=Lentinula guzmanii TaxID=2804957 RepID=A0AA38N1X0_9AGAR|nr:mannose-P-dolichol utilization defect 1 protein [Lentinula guzmanii]